MCQNSMKDNTMKKEEGSTRLEIWGQNTSKIDNQQEYHVLFDLVSDWIHFSVPQFSFLFLKKFLST